jgi:hypothetical protein
MSRVRRAGETRRWFAAAMRWLLVLLLVGCAQAKGAPLELLDCPATPYDGARHLWRGETPPRGRIWACEACAWVEEDAVSRMVALGCALRPAHGACTLTGACDYAAMHAALRAIAAAEDCEALEALTALDPCVRPDPDVYWRPEGD